MAITPTPGVGAQTRSLVPAPSTHPAGQADGRSADKLIDDLQTQRESSLAWQIVQRSLGMAPRAQESLAAPPTPAQETTPGIRPEHTAPESGGRIVTDRALQAEYVAAEIHLTQIQIGDDGVHIVEASLTYEHLTLRRGSPPVQKSDPLALDLDGDGIETTGLEGGRRFDLDADGRVDRASVITGGDAFLVLDSNGNGTIDDGRELFGDQNGHANGFEALRTYDDNGDARIDAGDAIYSHLKLLDWNTDGSQRLRSLAETGVASIALDYAQTAIALDAHDRVAQAGSFGRSDGSSGSAVDLMLGFSATA